ncbi:hypothetical protein [Pimelobacter sp. 30-1]|uniref:hypothetical protein n=1 Tax=Pimelobacter sp. 30-1 TaxID=2004991 RepID=UPI001C05CD44|nr:hypothetical protein [Pimelobacter sp. 30-1]
MQADPLVAGEPGEDLHRHVEVVAQVGHAAQRPVQRPEEVVPVDEHDLARPHRLDRLGPVLPDVVGALHAQLADPEVGHLGAAPGQRAGPEPGAALDQRGPAAVVLDQDRPGLAAAVGVHLDRRYDGRGDRAREAVGRAVLRLQPGQPEAADRHRLAGDHDRDPVGGQAAAVTDVRGRRPSVEGGAGPRGDGRGVHRVVVVGVHRRHRVEPVDPGTAQRRVDPGRVGADPAEQDARQRGTGEEAVGEHRRRPVVEQQRRHAEEGHPEPVVALGQAEPVGVPADVGATQAQAHPG